MIFCVPGSSDPIGRVAVVIPARFASTRYPGKPLVSLRGADGVAKPLIRRSWEAACRAAPDGLVYVATDDDRIRDAAEGFGAQVVMTPEGCANGTERCAAALVQLPDDIDIVVNLQGDAPLTPPEVVAALIRRLREDPAALVATPAVRCSPEIYSRLLDEQRNGRVGGTTVVFGHSRHALYFSKRVIPYVPAGAVAAEPPVWFHIGVYAYRRAALESYVASTGSLEWLEGLEQLRFLEAGVPVAIVEVPIDHEIWELNNPEDVAPIESILAARGIA